MEGRRWPLPQVIDPPQGVGKQRPQHRDLGQLEHHVAAVARDPGADLHQLLEQGRERPTLDILRQNYPNLIKDRNPDPRR
jgi:hypothetical protein